MGPLTGEHRPRIREPGRWSARPSLTLSGHRRADQTRGDEKPLSHTTRCTAISTEASPFGTALRLQAGFVGREIWNILSGLTGSVRLDTRELDHLGPLLGFSGDQLAEVGGLARKTRRAEVSKSRFGL